MIQVRGVAKAFGYRPVLRAVDLDARPGEPVVLVGENGAGKSTVLNILATLLKPDRGEVVVAGFDLTRPMEIRRRVGLVAHRTLLYEDLSVEQNLRFFGRMYDVPDAVARCRYLLESLRLWERRDQPVRTLSRGLSQRVAIGRALVHNPPVLLLDEPEAGLDAAAVDDVWDLILGRDGETRTVLLATHDLERVGKRGWRVVELCGGRVSPILGTQTPIEHGEPVMHLG